MEKSLGTIALTRANTDFEAEIKEALYTKM